MRGTACIHKLSARELETLFSAYVSSIVPGFAGGRHELAWIERARRYHGSQPSETRERLVAAARAYARTSGSFSRFVATEERIAVRTAALLADDLGAACSFVDQEARRDLLRFWVSEAATWARRRAGIA
jgi:hypothetical protein